MHKNIIALGLTPSVAALALFSTDFNGIEQAMAWLFESEEENSYMMLHPFVASLPASETFTKTYVQYLDEEDLEQGTLAASLVCYICTNEKARHRD